MRTRTDGAGRTNTVRGTLWLAAAIPFLSGPTLFDANQSAVGIGMMFLVFGMVSLRGRQGP